MGKHIFIFVQLILATTIMTAQEYQWLYSDPAVEVYLEPEIKRSGGVSRITKVHQPRLQIFKPDEKKNNGDFVLICPGGGYQILAIDLEGTEIAEYLTSLGYTAVVLEYTVPQDRDAALQDVGKAFKDITHFDEFKSDSKMGILGFSAGGHLAARFSTSENNTNHTKDQDIVKPDFTVLIYPAYLDKGENGGLSPEIKLSPQTPPMFIFVAADDKYAPSSLVLAKALQENKTTVDFHMLAEGGHGFGMREGVEAAETWPLLLEKWLKKI
ncbi:alpha/beta hydrolase [Portibacter marinus]|uniref:alpha/beta hydrolase n=1 Tax=Portibacter marinus TaxID=2898660 RepID=UPI001F323592|nr:alpha/beta hydrolase [Portibacter marinus]